MLGIMCDLEFPAVSTTVVPQIPTQHEKSLEVTHKSFGQNDLHL